LDQNEIILRLGLALAIGFLVGIERGWRSRAEREGERAAGLRTFALIGLSGGVWALLGQEIGPIAYAAGFVAFAAAITLFRWRETQKEGTYGATTLVAAMLTFAIGSYAAIGNMTVAAAAGVATVALLSAKGWLHGWLEAIEWRELRAALILLAMTFVALPILPNRGFGPYQSLNPHDLWVMTIAIAAVSFIGYVAVKIAGERYGALIAGIAGGIVSSTITTINLARRAKETPATLRFQLAGALAASATMFARVAVVVALFGPALMPRVLAPLASATLVSAVAALVFDAAHQAKSPQAEKRESHFQNPFEIKAVLLFGLLLAAVTVISRALSETFGSGGGIAFAALAGLGDVDAITLSMTGMAGGAISQGSAALAILLAVTANSVSKSVLAVVTGGRGFGLAYAAASALAILAGALAAYATSSGLVG
jgi:uncharacterized membrane protein (DUF4010 family)